LNGITSLPHFIKIYQAVQKLIKGTDRQDGDLISLFTFLESRLKCGYGNFDHRYNVSPIQLHVVWGVGNFISVHVYADFLMNRSAISESLKKHCLYIFLFTYKQCG